MAKALKCDICGSFYIPKFSLSSQNLNEQYSRKLILATFTGDDRISYDTTTMFDICPECTEKIVKWIKEGNLCSNNTSNE